MKLVPGSAEQRGTNFARALAGRTPFCRPLKAGRAYFLLTAEVDELSHDKLHLGLQARAPPMPVLASHHSMLHLGLQARNTRACFGPHHSKLHLGLQARSHALV